ncbi:hypothetical protein BGY98DRAFT_69530 [Russula aff. rugulosa BPL654]|nr:hypothetical protein BGY98DRAFT_69530 [Russula aff. rugulosa BPL654]
MTPRMNRMITSRPAATSAAPVPRACCCDHGRFSYQNRRRHWHTSAAVLDPRNTPSQASGCAYAQAVMHTPLTDSTEGCRTSGHCTRKLYARRLKGQSLCYADAVSKSPSSFSTIQTPHHTPAVPVSTLYLFLTALGLCPNGYPFGRLVGGKQ